MKDGIKTKLMLLSPLMAAGFSWCANKYLLTLISLIAVFFCISICSPCRRHESLWLFVLVGLATIPINIELSSYACYCFSYLWGDAFIMKFIYIPLAFTILLCLEEIVTGIIGRFLWREQDSVWG